jgi:hypothetical protein
MTSEYHRSVKTAEGLIKLFYQLNPKLNRRGLKPSLINERANMRTTFNIEIKADLMEDDPVSRAAFQEVLRDNAETLWSQCSLISKRTPTITITMVDEEVGTVDIPLFAGVFEEDYSKSEGE